MWRARGGETGILQCLSSCCFVSLVAGGFGGGSPFRDGRWRGVWRWDDPVCFIVAGRDVVCVSHAGWCIVPCARVVETTWLVGFKVVSVVSDV